LDLKATFETECTDNNKDETMKGMLRQSALLLTILMLTGCSALPSFSPETYSPHCIGKIEPLPDGLIATEDPELLQRALGAPNEGKLCQGQVFIVQKPIRVYRVWDSAEPESLYGSWWSLTPPTGTREQYRADNAICPAWSALNMLSDCLIKTGSKLVTGPGQSARCSVQLSYPASAINQIYLPNNRKQQLLQVETCNPAQPWPGSEDGVNDTTTK
jgi:hypothetical protein